MEEFPEESLKLGGYFVIPLSMRGMSLPASEVLKAA
jgi:hypothetical protein